MPHILPCDIVTSRGQYKKYTVPEKMKAVELAIKDGLRPTSAQLNIPFTTLSSWKKKFAPSLVNRCNSRNGRPLMYTKDLDMEICIWVLHKREKRIPVSRMALQNHARKVVNNPGFQATSGWVTRFMRRHNLVLRTRMSVAQQLPKDLELKIAAFLTNIKELRSEGEFDLIINMDETPIQFDMVPGKTINRRGDRSVIVRTTGAEKRRATTTLAVASSGDVLPPFMIFKGKRHPADLAVPGVEVAVQQNAWMTEELMLRWIENVLVPYTNGRPTLLVMDSFNAHTTDKVFLALTEANVTPTVIPGGCTSKVQPLDVCLNKPFKDQLRQRWVNYIDEQSEADCDKLVTASRQHVLEWVKESWASIAAKRTMIEHSFEACGITAALEEGSRTVTIERLMECDTSDEEFEGFTTSEADPMSPRGEDPFQL